MFKKSRSKRANRNAATAAQVPPTAAAAIAALQATNGNVQDGRLAAGAAAAALRSHTSSPVNVGEVQTRRMIRRNSITSATSDTSYQHGQMRMSRSGSISSMTSRTFRSPSPHGEKPSTNGAVPPVPAIPRSGATSPSNMRQRTFRRPASTEPTAPRVTSPTPQSARNMSVDTATRRKPAAISTSNLKDIAARNGSRNSINFSRPMSPENRPSSPSPTSPTARAKAGYSSPLSRYETDELEYQYQEVANKSVKRTKGLGGDEGSHLAAGTMGARSHGTAVDRSAARPKRMPLPRRISEEPEEEEFEEVFDPHTRTMIKRRKPGFRPKVAAAPLAPRSQPQSQLAAPAVQPQSPARSPARPKPAVAAPVVLPAPQEPKQRDVSASPARRARFASLRPEESTNIHEPARSLTPTKSALRKTPSPRGMSPADVATKRLSWNQPGFTPSEASETPSQLSDDRSKRRSVRVSFDDRPTIVGTSAAPITTDSPLVASPQNDKKKNWFGLRKNKAQAEESEEGMAPMPTLPSFGSVRGRRPTSEDGEEEEPLTAVLGIPGVALTTGEKTPSEAGSHADSHADEIDTTGAPPVPALPPKSERRLSGSTTKLNSGEVPVIAVIPGTPGLEHTIEDPLNGANTAQPELAETSPAVVGIAEPEPEPVAAAHDPDTPVVGHVAEAIKKQAEHSEKLETDSQDSHYSDAAEDVNGDGFGSINAIVESPVVTPESPKKKLAESLPPLTEAPPPEITPVSAAEADQGADATTFREAVVSEPIKADKHEKPVPTEPTQASQPTEARSTPPTQNSPVESITYNPRRMGSASSSDDSPNGQKRFAPNLRPSLEQRSSSELDDEDERSLSQTGPHPAFQNPPRQSSAGEAPSSSASPENTPVKSTLRAAPTASEPNSTTSTPARAGTEKKPLKSALKQTNRMSMPPEAVPAAQPRGTLQRKPRPVSSAGTPAPSQPSQAVMLAKAMLKVQEDKAKEAQAREANIQATLDRARLTAGVSSPPRNNSRGNLLSKTRRRGSDASDSSFKRGPSSVTSEGGRVSMRRSMRAGGPRPQSYMDSGSFRQSSRVDPPSRSRPTSMIGGGFASHSMRQPSRDPSPTRSILSFRKQKKAPSVQASARGPRASRFDDSSDDDGEPPVPAIQSRFEQRRANMRPVRGIPARTAEEVDSSDLDSDDEPIPALAGSNQEDRLMELARQRLGIEARPDVPEVNGNDEKFGQNDLVEAFAEKKAAEKPKRRSIFGTLSRRKNQSKVEKVQEESAARKDTPLERTVLQRKNTGTEPTSPIGTPERPRYSRQTTAERASVLQKQVDPDSWPLPESPTAAQRPETSDGSPTGEHSPERPPNRRQFSSESAPVYGRNGKKKRFPFLRRAFGLHN